MDVSPPDHPVHTWRDALVHLSIVTVGLFIALMLESAVEWLHHRQIVAEARANIAQEIADNRAIAQKDLGSFQANLARVKNNVATLQSMRVRRHIHGSLINTMDFETLNSSAWQTARETGALSYMPYREVQWYADLYDAIDFVNRHAESVATDEFQALAPAEMGYSMQSLPADEQEAMLRGNAQAEIGLTTLQQTLQQLVVQLDRAQKRTTD
jgi:hypothetical protein